MAEADKTVVFADLTGSTALFEAVGNERATALVRHCTSVMAERLRSGNGQIIKFLGDGLMAVFDDADSAIEACTSLGTLVSDSLPPGLPGSTANARVGLDHGPVIEVEGDAYGDAVNVAARMLEFAKPGEVLLTQSVFDKLSTFWQLACRDLGKVGVHGKVDSQQIFGMEILSDEPAMLTKPISLQKLPKTAQALNCIELCIGGAVRRFSQHDSPITIGRSAECVFVVPDARVSRMHARIEWSGSRFYLVDTSSNGTVISFAAEPRGDRHLLTLPVRRERCSLVGHGDIFLGEPRSGDPVPHIVFRIFQEG